MIGPIYFVTDAGAPLPVVDQAMRAAKGGARTIQIRDKTAGDAEMLDQLLLLKAALPDHVQLCVNDRVDLAVEAGLWGLHIGQSDGDPADIRARIGPDMILGLSVETPDQLAAIDPGVVNYLGVGPVRATASKPDHAPPLGFEGLSRIVAQADLPCVAIGGIGPGDLARVRGTGAVGVAVVSAIARADCPERAARALCEEWRGA